jgi:hypothetical protein
LKPSNGRGNGVSRVVARSFRLKHFMTKCNNYAGANGNGVNKIAILDPNPPATEAPFERPIPAVP